jgi:hypothetical protein
MKVVRVLDFPAVAGRVYHVESFLTELFFDTGFTHLDDLESPHILARNLYPNQVYLVSSHPTTEIYVAQYLNVRWVIPHNADPGFEIVTQKVLREKYKLPFNKIYQYLRLTFSGLDDKWAKYILKEYGSIMNFIDHAHELSERKLIRKHLESHPELWIT